MKLAITAVSEGMSVRRAALEFGVPKSSLQDRISGKVGIDAKSGPPRYLDDFEEEKLVNFLLGCSRIGYARSKKQVLALVSAIVAEKRELDCEEVVVTKGWWSSFQKRHPQLSLRSGEQLSYARAVAEDPEVFKMYYDLLEKTLIENELLNKPHLIFNCDESGFSLEHKPGKLIGEKGTKHLNSITSGDKAQLTVLACVSASGYSMPPMVIFDRKRLKPDHCNGEIPGSVYGLSSNGWIDSELFEVWFTKHFLTHIPAVRPVLLLLDGHSSHYQLPLIQRAAKENVIIFCLPPHTTHLLQPLDKTCFSPLKGYWNEECQKYISRNPGRVINRFNFSEIFARAWKKAMVPSTISSGFHSTGIYPFSRKAISVIDENAVNEIPTFVPFCSPVCRRPIKQNDRAVTYDFSDEERQKFQRRYEEGYNIPGDHRYEMWKSIQREDHAPLVSTPNVYARSRNNLKVSCSQYKNHSNFFQSDSVSTIEISPNDSGGCRSIEDVSAETRWSNYYDPSMHVIDTWPSVNRAPLVDYGNSYDLRYPPPHSLTNLSTLTNVLICLIACIMRMIGFGQEALHIFTPIGLFIKVHVRMNQLVDVAILIVCVKILSLVVIIPRI